MNVLFISLAVYHVWSPMYIAAWAIFRVCVYRCPSSDYLTMVYDIITLLPLNCSDSCVLRLFKFGVISGWMCMYIREPTAWVSMSENSLLATVDKHEDTILIIYSLKLES